MRGQTMGPNRLLTPHGKSLMRRPARPRRLWSFERLERRILLSQVQNPVGIDPFSSVSGDFNRDGALDVVTANEGSNDVSILLGNGDGTFQAPILYAAGISPTSIVVGSFEGEDRPLDLAVAGTDSNGVSYVSILQGDGYGGFHLSHMFALGD